jgi:hypothetical protein
MVSGTAFALWCWLEGYTTGSGIGRPQGLKDALIRPKRDFLGCFGWKNPPSAIADEPLSGDYGPLSTDNRPLSGDNRSLSTDNGSLSTDNGSLSTDYRPLSSDYRAK